MVALLVRLAVAPLHLPLSGWAVDALSKALDTPVHVGAVGVRLELGGVAIALDGVRLRKEAYSASIERISVLQSLFGKSVRLDGAAVRLDPSRGEPGAFSMPHPDAAIVALDGALAGVAGEASAAGINRVEVHAGRLDLVSAGRPIDEARVFQAVTAELDVADPDAITGRLSAIGASGPITAALARKVADDGRAALRIEGSGAAPRDFANAGPLRSGFAIAPTFSAVLSAEKTVTSARLEVDIGPGTVLFGHDPPRSMDSAVIVLSRAADGQSITIERAGIVAGDSRVFVTGALMPDAQDPEAPWLFELAPTEVHFDAPDIDGPPVDIADAHVSGNIDFAQRLLTVEAFHAAMPTARFDASLAFDFSAAGPNLTGAARIGPSSISSLMGAWPPVMAHGPRVAILNTVRGGFVSGGDVVFAMTPLELDGDPTTNDMIEGGFSADISFLDATLTTPEVPIAVLRASGAMRMRDKTLTARIDSGTVKTGEGGDFRVESGAFTIPTLAVVPPEGLLRATVTGPLSAVVAMAAQLDVPELKKTPLTPDDVEGEVRADLRLRTPLADNVPDSARIWEVDARLTNAGSKVPVAGQTFTNANIEVLINPRRLAARGRATIDGLKVDVNYSEIFNGEKSGAARFVLTDKDRKARGFDTGKTVEGPVVVTVEALDDDTRVFAADLTEAAISLPVFAKPAGEVLNASGKMTGDPANLNVENLEVTGRQGVDIEGSLTLEGGELKSAVFPRLALSDGDDAKLLVEREGDTFRATFDASRFDARTIVEQVLKSSGGETPDEEEAPPYALELEVEAGRLRLREDKTVTDLAISARQDKGKLQRLSAQGKVDGINAGSFALALKPGENGTRRLQADITTLGRALDALGIYSRMRGGRTILDARLDPDGVMAGRLTATDFVLADEMTLESILQRARAENQFFQQKTGKPLGFQATNAVDGLSFDKLSVDFTKRGDRIDVSEAILRGPLIGGTANGQIDLASRTILLNGTLIPAYGVNNLFGRLPIFGEILGGGNKGGLIGVTFRVSGPIDDPQITVNPMSAIAPGIFRRIFEFR